MKKFLYYIVIETGNGKYNVPISEELYQNVDNNEKVEVTFEKDCLKDSGDNWIINIKNESYIWLRKISE